MEILKEIAKSVRTGDDEKVTERVGQAIEEQIPVLEILDKGLIAGMKVVGDQFRVREVFLPDMLLAARALTAGHELLKPLLFAEEVPSRGKVVIGSVHGDFHDIGKNLVGIMLRGAGFEVIDLGNDVPPERFVDTAVAENAMIIGMSALLTTSMSVMKDVVELLREKGLTKSVKVIVGGAPLAEQFALEIGADAYAQDATDAVDRVRALLGEH
jgi:5-methyltetrahydrofolate--homocysteine methyltransferase